MFVTTLPYMLATEHSDVIVIEQYFSYTVFKRLLGLIQNMSMICKTTLSFKQLIYKQTLELKPPEDEYCLCSLLLFFQFCGYQQPSGPQEIALFPVSVSIYCHDEIILDWSLVLGSSELGIYFIVKNSYRQMIPYTQVFHWFGNTFFIHFKYG